MKKIIVPTDFSEYANNALDLAAEIAKTTNAEIELLSVLEAPYASGGFNTSGEPVSGNSDSLYIMEQMKKTKKQMTEAKKKHPDVTINDSVEVDRVFHTIAHYVEKHDADLVVMGTHGASGWEELLVGSNAERMVRYSECPVLTVREKTSLDFRNIVFASSFDEDLGRVMNHVKKLRDLFSANLHLLKVIVPGLFESTRQSEQSIKEFAQKYELEDYEMHVYNDHDIDQGIMHFAHEHNMDMIMLYTHGRKGLGHLISGSIAEDLVNHTKLPVLTFNNKVAKNG